MWIGQPRLAIHDFLHVGRIYKGAGPHSSKKCIKFNSFLFFFFDTSILQLSADCVPVAPISIFGMSTGAYQILMSHPV